MKKIIYLDGLRKINKKMIDCAFKCKNINMLKYTYEIKGDNNYLHEESLKLYNRALIDKRNDLIEFMIDVKCINIQVKVFSKYLKNVENKLDNERLKFLLYDSKLYGCSERYKTYEINKNKVIIEIIRVLENFELIDKMISIGYDIISHINDDMRYNIHSYNIKILEFLENRKYINLEKICNDNYVISNIVRSYLNNKFKYKILKFMLERRTSATSFTVKNDVKLDGKTYKLLKIYGINIIELDYVPRII